MKHVTLRTGAVVESHVLLVLSVEFESLMKEQADVFHELVIWARNHVLPSAKTLDILEDRELTDNRIKLDRSVRDTVLACVQGDYPAYTLVFPSVCVTPAAT